MNHNQETAVVPLKSSSNRFGVDYENNFVVMDDAKHVIGLDARDAKNLILENVESGKADKFGWSQSYHKYISTLVYDKDTGSLYTGDDNGHLHQYKIDKASKSCQRVKNYGDLRIGRIMSSHRFLHFVFFGGDIGRIKVLDLSTGELLPGWLQTSPRFIYSLHVCVKSHKEIYLAVSGGNDNYFTNNTDLFNVTDLFLNNQVILRKYLQKYSSNYENKILPQPTTLKSQLDTSQNLRKEKDSNKAELNQMHSKYNHLIEIYDKIHKNNKNKKLPQAHQTQRTQLHTKSHHNNQMTTKTVKKCLIEKRSFDEIDPLVITKELKEDIPEEKNVTKKCQNMTYNKFTERKEDKQELERFRVILDPVQAQGLKIEEIKDKR